MTASLVVINAGPLMVLAKLNLLHLLKQLYGQVLFAEAVYRDVPISLRLSVEVTSGSAQHFVAVC